MSFGTSDEEDWEDAENGDESFDDSAEDEPTVACPYCGREIHEDSPRCPYCENYISEEGAPAARKSWLVVVGAIIALALVCWWITH
jgi:uncharacterized paraquat-inducible protein A